eukprot:7973210-Lingulodinium_polyedra.AAC.1
MPAWTTGGRSPSCRSLTAPAWHGSGLTIFYGGLEPTTPYTPASSSKSTLRSLGQLKGPGCDGKRWEVASHANRLQKMSGTCCGTALGRCGVFWREPPEMACS